MAGGDLSVDLPQDAGSPIELLNSLDQAVLELRSYLGQGYQFVGCTQGRVSFSKPDDSEMSDRERVSAAFLDLAAEFGYPQCLDFSWECPDLDHALALLVERGLEGRSFAFWTSDTDNHSFGYPGYSRVLHEEFESLIAGGSDDVMQQWFEDNYERIESQEKSERLQHGTLVCPLVIHYQGDPVPVVTCLTRHGLKAVSSSVGSILVIPKGVDISNGDYNSNLGEFFPDAGD